MSPRDMAVGMAGKPGYAKEYKISWHNKLMLSAI
jgi:hypothetical protein